jgi:hypothetical protein
MLFRSKLTVLSVDIEMARGLDTGQGEAAVVAAVAGRADGNRALHLAAARGSMDVLRYLVEDLHLSVNQFNAKGLALPLFRSIFSV